MLDRCPLPDNLLVLTVLLLLDGVEEAIEGFSCSYEALESMSEMAVGIPNKLVFHIIW